MIYIKPHMHATSVDMFHFILQVLIPSSGYAGQKRKMPVASGTTPIQPHRPLTGQAQRDKNQTCGDAQTALELSNIGFFQVNVCASLPAR